jgi:DNA-binding SARP family transcriptional activator
LHDLGPTSFEVGDREVMLTDTRRKPATLLLYMVTRPRLAAPREQVLESLWPDQSPRSAINSLHQTLFFLRRDIEPWYEEGSTANYVRMESDMVFLDPEMFQVDSVAFNRQVADIMRTGTARDRGPDMLKLYRGRFAPEFEYEEWAESWRTQLHGAYLHLAHSVASAFARDGRYSEAVEILLPVMLVDPLAFDLRGMLVACLAAQGSADAAVAHYRSLATLYSRDLGVPAPSYDDVISSLGS